MEIPDVRMLEVCNDIITDYMNAVSDGDKDQILYAGKRSQLAMLFNISVPQVHHQVVKTVRDSPIGSRWADILFAALKKEMEK